MASASVEASTAGSGGRIGGGCDQGAPVASAAGASVETATTSASAEAAMASASADGRSIN
uniref:Uncharacterized protein n=1 Tax=Arundo donax TaxID=35708 RepID=A0A0A9BSU0_ARUDO